MSDLNDDGRLVPGTLTGTSTGASAGTPNSGGDPRGPAVTDGGTKIVTARGTEDGLILRIDGRAEWHEILTDLEAFLGGRKRFFEGGEVSIEWLDRLPTVEQTKDLEVFLRTNFGMEVSSRRRRAASLSLAAASSQPSAPSAGGSPVGASSIGGESRGKRRDATTIQLFDEVVEGGSLGTGGRSDLGFGLESPRSDAKFEQLRRSSVARGDSLDSMIERELIDATGSDGDFGDLSRLGLSGGDLSGRKYASRMGKMLGDDLFYEDDANAKVVFGTLRSGQRLETPFSLIVIGDVNPGADLVAGGDIVVFGSLKGTAHASAYDDDAFDRVIVALQMQPMQLRIGSVISRGSDEVVKGAEIARIENRRIIVEAFNPRAMLGKKIR